MKIDSRLNQDLFKYAIDLEAVKGRSGVPSETTATRDAFREAVLDRDA